MSTHQQAKPRRANQSITEESRRPGTVKSKVGWDAIEEPWTKRIADFPSADPTNFSHMNRRTSPSGVLFVVQCSTPVTGASVIASRSVIGESRWFDDRMASRSIDLRAGLAEHSRPELLLRAEESAELGRCRADDLDAGGGHVALYVGQREHRDHCVLDLVDDWRRRSPW